MDLTPTVAGPDAAAPDTDTQPSQSEAPIRFRAGKKRKAYRQRPDEEADEAIMQPSNTESSAAPEPSEVTSTASRDNTVTQVDTATSAPATSEGVNDDNNESQDNDSAVAAALRARNANARKARMRGVGFTSDSRTDSAGQPSFGAGDRSLVLRQDADQDPDAPPPMLAIADRFAHQTGLISDLDERHMNAYIESHLSSRSAAQYRTIPSTRGASDPSHSSAAAAAQSGHRSETPARPDQSVTQGKLVEVDLDNIAAQLPQRHHQQQGGAGSPNKKVRLGKDGKPWRPRNRRGSDDIKRDQLVEAFLHENRLDVYDVPGASSSQNQDAPDDGNADERLAEQFKRQYMDDLAQRRQKKKPPARPTRQQQQQQNEDVLKGPKLGGSRNARAAVRNALLQKEKEARK